MWSRGFSRIFVVISLLMTVPGMLSGCGGITLGGGVSKVCAPNTAQIEVYDVGMRRGCGCTEGASSQVFTGTNSFNCTISLGTTVYFTYVAIQNTHTIGSSPVTSGCNFNPKYSSSAGAVDACTPQGTGTFSIVDSNPFNGLQLIVIP